jgi:hypothetical protein
MPATDTASRLTPYIEELLDNEYARENLREGASQLRAAYERSQKRRVKATHDRKLHRKLESAGAALGAGAKALASGRRKPERRRGRRLAWLLGIGVFGAGLALAANEDLRSSLFGTSSHPAQPPEGSRG